MRQFIIASHAHFAAGINESVSLLSGERDNVRTLSMYVDGNNDLAAAAAKMLDETPEGDDLVVCTDLFGGSVNNEFTSIVQRRPNTYLVTNMNLPLLIQLLSRRGGARHRRGHPRDLRRRRYARQVRQRPDRGYRGRRGIANMVPGRRQASLPVDPMKLESVMRNAQATSLLACAFCLPRSRGAGQSGTVDRE